jgi:8-oxo-dGTP pyrophosphatase MutT (NUDIX family)
MRFDIAGKAMIRDGAGRCLVIRRSGQSKHWPGMWELAGGKAEAGETFEEAMRREVREETGLEIELRRWVGTAPYRLVTGKGELELLFVVVEAMVSGSEGGRTQEVRLSSEHLEYRWVSEGELGGMELTPPVRAALSRDFRQ